MNIRLNYADFLAAETRLFAAFNDPSIVRQSKHRLRSGAQASFFVDFDILVNDPQRCADIVSSFSARIFEISLKRQIDLLAFVEKTGRGTTGAIRVGGAISIEVGIPSFIVRLGKELPFERVKLPSKKGEPAWRKLEGLGVVLITDHITSGGEVLKAVEAIEGVGGQVSDILSYTLKPTDAISILKQLVEKNILIHSSYWIYDVEAKSYRIAQGGTIDSNAEIIKTQP